MTELNSNELNVAINGKISELIRLLTWYQRRVELEQIGAAQLDLFAAAKPVEERMILLSSFGLTATLTGSW